MGRRVTLGYHKQETNWKTESLSPGDEGTTGQVLEVEQVGNGEKKEDLLQARNTCTWWGKGIHDLRRGWSF